MMPTVPYYLKDGTRVPGCTTVISTSLGWGKEGLLVWANREGQAGRDHRETRQAAADVGTLAHALVEARIRNVPFERPPTATEEQVRLATLAFNGFEEWFAASRIELVETEMHLVSERHRFGGTPDAVGKHKGTLCVLDWKASRAVYPEHLIQIAAYQQLWDENRPEPIGGGVHLCKFAKDTGGFSHHWWPSEALEPAWRAFLALRDLYDLQKEMKALAA